MKTNDGGPAFPREDYQGDYAPGQRGMSLRDYFAAAALKNLMSTGRWDNGAQVASLAYQFADAMLAERNKAMINSTS